MKFVGTIFLIFLSIQTYAQTIQERLKAPVVGAHQGGYPWKGKNNTLVKFNQAIKDGAGIVEMDIQVTKDNIVVVFHDGDLSSGTSCSGPINQKNYDEITRCPYSNGMQIEKFENVILGVNVRAVINAEFKTMDVVVPAIKLIQKHSAYDWVYFQTKAEREKYLLARNTDNKVALLYKTNTNEELDWILSLDDPNLIVIEMEKEMATPTNIQKVHNVYKLVTVNSWRYGSLEELFNAACDKVFKLGIDIAIANNISSCVKQKNKIKSRRRR